MSYGREYLADHAFEMDYPFGLPSKTWKTRDGREIRIRDMTESHIRNCMRIVGEDDRWFYVFQKELERRR